eukprot:3647376-Prymnesium_polylepis.1
MGLASVAAVLDDPSAGRPSHSPHLYRAHLQELPDAARRSQVRSTQHACRKSGRPLSWAEGRVGRVPLLVHMHLACMLQLFSLLVLRRLFDVLRLHDRVRGDGCLTTITKRQSNFEGKPLGPLR